MDQRTAPPLGSMSDARDEGSRQRRVEFFRTRRLVGGGLFSQVGWAIGDGLEHGDDPALDALEAEATYTLLERELVPEFYERSANGLPSRWLERIRESMARLTPEFSASRTIQEYTEKHYLPAASAYENALPRTVLWAPSC